MIVNSCTIATVEREVPADVLVSVITCVCHFLDQVWDVFIALIFTLLIMDTESVERDPLEAMAIVSEDSVSEIYNILSVYHCTIYL